MSRRRLPIGIQTFRTIREDDAYYVDKTPWIERLVDEGQHYFLSRPRRFGKSLLLDTMKELFEGNKALFEGLAIHDRWDWSVKHPVVRLSFGAGDYLDPGGLGEDVEAQLEVAEEGAGVPSSPRSPSVRLRRLLRELHEQSGHRAVLLVDEYDKPILDALIPGDEVEDGTKIAQANRRFLRSLYSAVKEADAHLRFSFLTGVSKFSKVNLFSGLNNLKDITLDRRYAAICGYTERDLETVFAPELEGLDRQRVQEWYNGYNWGGEERVYNPFGTLLLFDTREFKAHWFETGSPRFLVDQLFEQRFPVPRLDKIVASEDLLSTFDIGDISTEALLFQTGYLTIEEEVPAGDWMRYRLGYPNLEVRQSLNRHLLRRLDPDRRRVEANQARLFKLLEAGDAAGMKQVFHAFFAGIPHQWFTKNRIAEYEGYYASVFCAYFHALGADVAVEESTNLGRLDMAVRFGGRVFLFEFKVVSESKKGSAMTQLVEKKYAEKYRGRWGADPPRGSGVRQRDAEHHGFRGPACCARLTERAPPTAGDAIPNRNIRTGTPFFRPACERRNGARLPAGPTATLPEIEIGP